MTSARFAVVKRALPFRHRGQRASTHRPNSQHVNGVATVTGSIVRIPRSGSKSMRRGHARRQPYRKLTLFLLAIGQRAPENVRHLRVSVRPCPSGLVTAASDRVVVPDARVVRSRAASGLTPRRTLNGGRHAKNFLENCDCLRRRLTGRARWVPTAVSRRSTFHGTHVLATPRAQRRRLGSSRR